MSEISDKIATDATQPAKATVDGVSVEKHKLTDLIEADKHSRVLTAMKNRTLSGIRIVRQKMNGGSA